MFSSARRLRGQDQPPAQTLDIVDRISPTPIWCVRDPIAALSGERSSDMTLEEIEFKRQYPRFPKSGFPRFSLR